VSYSEAYALAVANAYPLSVANTLAQALCGMVQGYSNGNQFGEREVVYLFGIFNTVGR